MVVLSPKADLFVRLIFKCWIGTVARVLAAIGTHALARVVRAACFALVHLRTNAAFIAAAFAFEIGDGTTFSVRT